MCSIHGSAPNRDGRVSAGGGRWPWEHKSLFGAEQGFVIESRSGGGGYIRIYRVESDRAGHVMHIVNAVGDRLDAVTAERYLKNMCDFEVITAEQARLMAAAVSDKVLSRLERERRSEVRADIFKNMLVAIIA